MRKEQTNIDYEPLTYINLTDVPKVDLTSSIDWQVRINSSILTEFKQKIKQDGLLFNDFIVHELTQEVSMYNRLYPNSVPNKTRPQTAITITYFKEGWSIFANNIKKDHKYCNIDAFFEDFFRKFDNLHFQSKIIDMDIKKAESSQPTHEHIIHIDAKLIDSVKKLCKKNGIYLKSLINYAIIKYNNDMLNYTILSTKRQLIRLPSSLCKKLQHYLSIIPDYKYNTLGYSKPRLCIERIMIKYLTNGYDILFPQFNFLHHISSPKRLTHLYPLPSVLTPQKVTLSTQVQTFDPPGLFIFADFETSLDVKAKEKLEHDASLLASSANKAPVIKLQDYYNKIKTRVYGAGWTYGNSLFECEQNYVASENVNDFLKFIKHYLHGKVSSIKKAYCYFHNTNYDFQYIKSALLLNFECTEYLGDERKFYQLKIICKKTGYQFYLIDNLNIQRMPLSKLPTSGNYSKDLTTDMSIIRDISHKITTKELSYLKRDVLTLADSVFLYFSNKPFHLTSGGYAMRVWREHMTNLGLNEYFQLSKKGYLQDFNKKRFKSYNRNCLIYDEFSKIDCLKEMEIHYKGGQTLINHIYQEKVLHTTITLDVNSLYPFAYLQAKVPYYTNVNSLIKRKSSQTHGISSLKLVHFYEVYLYISIYESISCLELSRSYYLHFDLILDVLLRKGLTFSPLTRGMTCSKDGKGGVLQIREFIASKVRSIKDATLNFAGSEYDLANWSNYYELSEASLCSYYIFDILEGHALNDYRSIVDNWKNEKITLAHELDVEANPIKKAKLKVSLANVKLLLNSLTGKFGEKMRFDEIIIEDHEFKTIEAEKIENRLLPIILSIISFARYYMGYNMIKVKDYFVYCDTDSITTVGLDEEKLLSIFNVHDSEFGAFKIDKKFEQAIFMKPKTYIGQVGSTYKITVAGCKIKDEVRDDNGNIISLSTGSKLAKKYSMKQLLAGDKIIGEKVLKVPLKNGVLLLTKPFIFKGDETLNIEGKYPKLMIDYIKLKEQIIKEDQVDIIEETQENLYGANMVKEVTNPLTYSSII